jgi:hypothetical protein
MNLKLEFLHEVFKEYHVYCIRNILAKKNIHDDIKMLMINKHLNWLKQVDNAYNMVNTINSVRELTRRN